MSRYTVMGISKRDHLFVSPKGEDLSGESPKAAIIVPFPLGDMKLILHGNAWRFERTEGLRKTGKIADAFRISERIGDRYRILTFGSASPLVIYSDDGTGTQHANRILIVKPNRRVRGWKEYSVAVGCLGCKAVEYRCLNDGRLKEIVNQELNLLSSVRA